MRWVLRILGILLLLTGVVWILQGLNVLLGSVMSGNIMYSYLGLLAAVIGAVLLVLASRLRGVRR